MKIYPNQMHTIGMRKESTGTALATESQDDLEVKFFRNAAHEETIMALLARLAMLKHHRGTEKERAYSLRDCTQRLTHYRVTELDLFDAVEHLIDNDDNDFFPSYAKLHKIIFGKTEEKTKRWYDHD